MRLPGCWRIISIVSCGKNDWGDGGKIRFLSELRSSNDTEDDDNDSVTDTIGGTVVRFLHK